jgi:dihydropyrimidinase
MFGLYPRKGTIAVGSDADLVIYDPGTSFIYSAPDTIHGNIDYTCYEGMRIDAKIDRVLSRGKVIIDDDRYLGSNGDGSYLKRGMSQLLI